MEPIKEVEVAKDLGIMFDNNIDFRNHRNKAIMKTSNKVSWILRTFINRDTEVMRTLWKQLVQPHQDYGCLVWAPVVTKCDFEAQEGPLRKFSRKLKGMYDLNYWDRLKKLRMSSIQRRVECFKIFHT